MAPGRVWQEGNQSRRGQLLRLLVAVLSVQLSYWLIVRPVLFAPPPPPPAERLAIANPRIAKVTEPTLGAIAKAAFKPVELPADDCCGPGYRVLQVDLDLDVVPERGLGVIWQVNTDNYWLAVNGQWAHQRGRLALPDITYEGNVKAVVAVPAGLLKPGRNSLSGIQVRDGGAPWFDFYSPMIAPHDKLVASTRHMSFLRNEYKTISATIAGVMALLALVLAIASRGSAFPVTMAILFAAWGLRMVYYVWNDPPISGTDRLAAYFLLTITIPFAWLMAANEWTGAPWRWLRWLGVTLWLGLAGFVIWQINTAVPDGYDLAGWLVDISGMALGVAAVARFAWHLSTRPETRYWEAAILTLGVTVSAMSFLQFFTGAMVSDNLETLLPLLAVGFAVAFFERNITLFRSTDDLNTYLSGELAQREVELAKSYQEREELSKRQALVDERQRIMRDMHDGIGGQLMSLLFAARRAPIAQADLSESLQAIIDELRLIIDSMDSIGDRLGAALAMFRNRIEPRLSAAGIALDWENALPDNLEGLEPERVMQIFRVVQEAVTNAVKHSGADRLQVRLGMAAGKTDQIELRIADNGKGMGDAKGSGYGLANMSARANVIGGKLDIQSSAKGTAVVLTVPAG